VDKVLFFIAPKILGGIDSIPSIGGKSPARLKGAYKLKDLRIMHFGEDILVEGYTGFITRLKFKKAMPLLALPF
jgi:diaminohydroxyphosphoribosylaminopyrimidine deaminase/5-amino-6-(5-phosphoribosylamino)uracil reductase